MKQILLAVAVLAIFATQSRAITQQNNTLGSAEANDTTAESPYKITIEYKQPIEGYKIIVNGSAFGSDWVEYVNGTLSLIKNGDTINIEVFDFGDKGVLFKKARKKYLLDYNAPEEDSSRFNAKSKLPFVFVDIDSDGKKELLINDWQRGQAGNNYSVYQITDKAAKADYPFTLLNDIDTIDFDNQILSKYVGVSWNCARITYKIDNQSITTDVLPLETMDEFGLHIVEEMNLNKNSRYKLAEFNEYTREANPWGSYHYERRGDEMVLIKFEAR